jgi:hypothetical protein
LIIAWHEISRRPDLTEQLLELARTDIISSSHAQLQSEEPITLGSIPGKELRLAPSEGAIKARVYATKNMAYEVAVLSSMARMSSADVEKFFDSFKLTADSGETPTAPENKDNIDPGAAAKIDPAPAPVASIATAQRQSSGCVTPPSGLAYWWRGEGDTRDAVGGNNGTPQGRITYTTGEVGKAFNLDGSSGYISTSTRISNPQTFSLSLWFRTGATQGGVLISFDSSQASELVRGRLYDRNIYMDNAGALHFGVWNGNPDQIDTRTGYNDNKWHQVVGSLSADTGLSFYVDGTLAGNNPAVTRAVETYDGYWRIGEGKLDNWPNPPASLYFKGQIDEVAIFDTALSAIDVAAIYGAGRNGMCRP